MAFTAKKETTVVKRHDYFVPDGSTSKDLSDAFRQVLQDMPEHKASYDDAFHVRAGDEGIYLYWEEEVVD